MRTNVPTALCIPQGAPLEEAPMKKLISTIALVAFTSPVFATITPYIPATSPLVLPDGTIVGDLIQFTPSPATAMWHVDPANAYIANQGLGNSAVEVFAEGLVGNDLDFIYGINALSGHEAETLSVNPFNVVALHYANKELVFYYETAITEFTIGDIYAENGYDLNQEVSNLRVFANAGNPNPTTADAPGALALLGMGLVALGVSRRTRIK